MGNNFLKFKSYEKISVFLLFLFISVGAFARSEKCPKIKLENNLYLVKSRVEGKKISNESVQILEEEGCAITAHGNLICGMLYSLCANSGEEVGEIIDELDCLNCDNNYPKPEPWTYP